MAIARRELVDKQTPGFYHCTNRCVRRAFLCGTDDETGKNFEHRKAWLEDRFYHLTNIFSVDIYAYAVMDNHYHLVLYLEPGLPKRWSDEDVAERWLRVYPSRLDKPENVTQRELKKRAIMDNPELLQIFRQRLGDLSWFMRRLNEPLAKLSNQEDFCTGRFWEGRYTSQALLDEAAVLSCMTYVDLNPVRARITEKLEESNHTSIKHRLENLTAENTESRLNEIIRSVSSSIQEQKLTITLREYMELTEWAGKSIIHPGKASIPAHLQPILERLNLQPSNWLKQIENYEKFYCRVAGPVDLIRHKAKVLKQKYLRGVNAAKQFYLSPT